MTVVQVVEQVDRDMRIPKHLERKIVAQAGAAGKPVRVVTHGEPSAPACVWTMTITVPGLVVVSEANQRCHWTVRANRFASQKATLLVALTSVGWAKSPPFDRAEVTLTRLGGRGLDSDNLAGSFKAVRDALADWLGVDDGSDRVAWHYGQRPGGERGVCVSVRGE